MTGDAPQADGPPAAAGPPAPSVTFFLANVGRRAREAVDARLLEHGLGLQHLSALGHLHRQPGLSYSELARRAGVTVQSMQTTVGLLQRRGLVDPGPRTSQGRRAQLEVTGEGREVLATGQAAVRALDDELLAGFTTVERTELESSLFRLFRAQTAGRHEPAREADPPA